MKKGGRIIEGKIDIILQSGVGTRLKAPIAVSDSGRNEVFAAPASGFRYKIVKLVLVPSGAVTVAIESGQEALSGQMALAANAIFVFNGDFNPIVLNEAEAFNLILGGAVAVNGFVQFIKEAV